MFFYKFLFFLNDFLEIQRRSFASFLNFGFGLSLLPPNQTRSDQRLPEGELSSGGPFGGESLSSLREPAFFGGASEKCRGGERDHQRAPSVHSIASAAQNFLYENYKFTKPTLNIEKSILFGKTYCCHFYLPVQDSNSNLQWIFFGTLPLLTRRGHFIINGTPRIVLNQIVRSAGVYFKKEQLFYAEIISDRGPWIQFEIDSQKKIWISHQHKPRFFLDTPFDRVGFAPTLFYQQKLNLMSAISNASGLGSLTQFFLGKNGRNRFNKRLGLCLHTSILTPIDLVAICNILLKGSLREPSSSGPPARWLRSEGPLRGPPAFFGGSPPTGEALAPYGGERGRASGRLSSLREVDDIDDLKNRRLKTIGELIQNQIIRGLQRLQILLKNKKNLASQASPVKVNTTPINSTLKEFFHSHQLSQYLDQSNPLAEITHKRRLSSGGVIAGLAQRSIHQTYYGRICPIETPEGKNAGLVNSLTTAASLNSYNFLETPFVEVYKQHFQNQKKLRFLAPYFKLSPRDLAFFNQTFPRHFLSASRRPKVKLFAPPLEGGKCPLSTKLRSVGGHASGIKGIEQYQLNSINLLAKTAQQFLSIATTCIPFIEHDDANRALMGSNMQRQALPLIFLEQPLISTSNAFRVLSDLKDIPISTQSSFPIYISKQKICLIYLNAREANKKQKWSKLNYMIFQFHNFKYNVD
uniref:DNA-directed RNA polymerase n=1 Tax=Halimeda minima TaxID=170427 RepID=A0A386AYT1_9CHLO|nr:RNA polymerase b-subunit [Halimeda minima]